MVFESGLKIVQIIQKLQRTSLLLISLHFNAMTKLANDCIGCVISMFKLIKSSTYPFGLSLVSFLFQFS